VALNSPEELRDAILDDLVEDRSYVFFRALHHRESPHPVLRGSLRWLAPLLGIRADIIWTRDPDWEPARIEWVEDSLMP
jgi:hypothetical protein